MEVYTLAVDLKITPDHEICLLEIMSANYAGFTGYKAATGKDMLKDTVFPALEKLHSPFYYAEGFHEYKELTEELADDTPDCRALLYLPQGYLIRDNYFKAAESGPHSLINADPDFLLLADNKAVFHHHMEQFMEQGAHDVFIPPTYTGVSSYHDGLAGDIRDKIGTHDHYILKAPDTANGTGLRLIADHELEEALKSTFPPEGQSAPLMYRAREGVDPYADYWRQKPAPVFLVQPCVSGKPLSREGKCYDGTMRVTLTAYRDGKNEPFQIMTHDGYWKLPLEPVKAGRPDAGNLVSYSYGNREKNRPGFLKDLFNCLTGRQEKRVRDTYMAVDPADLSMVMDKMEAVMPSFMKQVCAFDLAAATKDWLLSDDKTMQALGVMGALDGRYRFCRNEKAGAPEKGPGDEMLESRLMALIRPPEMTAVQRYAETFVAGIFHYKNYALTSLPPQFVKEMEKERLARIKRQNLSTVAHDMHHI